ncbi:MAG: FG-GAP-like repeat-containing protein [Candidatus Eiseniibacteriota bacterium]|jgi:hypothetical protein
MRSIAPLPPVTPADLLVALLVALLAASLAAPAFARSFSEDDVPLPVQGGYPPVDVVADSFLEMAADGDTLAIPYFASRPLLASHPAVTRLVIVVHGTLRNADDYYLHMKEAATLADTAQDHTLIVAPQFLIEEDLDEHDLPESTLFWEYYGWRQGDQSVATQHHPRPWSISSYAIADTIIHHVVTRNPQLEQVIVTGHSAGGQFTNRYAAGNLIHDLVTGTYGVAIRYIVMNPSTCMYFDAERWLEGTAYAFGIPPDSTLQSCPEYNDYKYGVDNPNPYMAIGTTLLRQHYLEREVIHLAGERDNDPNSTYLDRACPAMLMGRHRLERAIIYWQHLLRVFGPSFEDDHALAIVRGSSHDHNTMFKSPCGLATLFDYGTCVPLSPPSDLWVDVTTPELAARFAHAPAWGDADGDGVADLYVAGPGDVNRLFHGLGDGTFVDATAAPLDDDGLGWAAAWIDVDSDGDQDLHLVNWGDPCRLYRNDGAAGFVDVASGVIGSAGPYADQAWADVDLDGDLDVALSRYSDDSNLLLRNDGAAGFEDVTSAPFATKHRTRGLSFGDVDADGDQDLVVASHGPNQLLRNDGDTSFEDITDSTLGDPRASTCAIWGDADGDGDLDLFVANRTPGDQLLLGDGTGAFEEVSAPPLTETVNSGSATWGDLDLDGDLDLHVSNDGGINRLHRNDGGGTFTDVTVMPVGNVDQSRGAALADVDLDGDLDLYLATHEGANKLFRNDLTTGNHWLAIELRGGASNAGGVGARLAIEAGGTTQARELGTGGTGYQAAGPLVVQLGLGDAAQVDRIEVVWPSGYQQEAGAFGADRRIVIEEQVTTPGPPPTPPVAGSVRLEPARPNPFGATTTLAYEVAVDGPVSLRVYDVAGRLVRVLDALPERASGRYRAVWAGDDGAGRRLAGGIYYVRLEAAGAAPRTQPVVLVR